MSDQTCSACGTQVASYDGVLLSAKEGTRFLCSRCYNETVAEYLGLDYEHVAFDPGDVSPNRRKFRRQQVA